MACFDTNTVCIQLVILPQLCRLFGNTFDSSTTWVILDVFYVLGSVSSRCFLIGDVQHHLHVQFLALNQSALQIAGGIKEHSMFFTKSYVRLVSLWTEYISNFPHKKLQKGSIYSDA